MWRRVDLRNYRSIESATVDLSPFTILVGPNGSGKSNFADAIVFVRDVGLDAATAVEKRGGIVGVRRWRRTKPYDVSVSIRAAKTSNALSTEYVQHAFTIHSRNEGRWNFSRETLSYCKVSYPPLELVRQNDQIAKKPGESYFPKSIPPTTSAMLYARQMIPFSFRSALSNVRRIRLNADVMRQPQIATEKTRLEEDGSNVATMVKLFRQTKRIDFVVRALAKIVPGLVDIEAQSIGRFLSLQFIQTQSGGNLATFSATEMSEGALRALGIIIAARDIRRDQLLIIEEPEVNLHPGATAVLFDVLKVASQRGAVLVTTHSAELLDAAKDEEILVCDYRTGISRIGRLATAQREIVRKGLFSVAELMRSEPLRIEGEPVAAVGDHDSP
jgi:type I restriction enzyme M protein